MKDGKNVNNSQGKRQTTDINLKRIKYWNYETKTFEAAIITTSKN